MLFSLGQCAVTMTRVHTSRSHETFNGQSTLAWSALLLINALMDYNMTLVHTSKVKVTQDIKGQRAHARVHITYLCNNHTG